MNFKKKKVLIMGLGLHGGGVGVAKFFLKKQADVLITDLKSRKELKDSLTKLKGLPIKYVLGKHRKEDFLASDLVIKNPAVPWNSKYLKIAGEKVKTDITVFFELCKSEHIIGITGTKGKSTTATLTYLFLKEKYPSFLAGNIGVSPLEIVDKINKDSRVVLELSSFELEGLEKSPKTALITNILKDHLDRYETMEEYIAAKKNIFKYQKSKDILVLNYDNKITRSFKKEARGKVFFFSQKAKKDCYLSKDTIYFKGTPVSKAGNLNLSNLLAAISLARLSGVSVKKIRKVLSSFKGVPGRQEFIAEKRGVKYYNDTTATMPDAVIEALERFKNPILIAGGVDKGLDYSLLSEKIEKKAKHLILLPGTASLILKKKVKNAFLVSSMKEAVKKAASLAEKGDSVILSPGAASFNLFKNEFDRGDKFKEEVRKI